MVEVFKTNVSSKSQASMLIEQIHKHFIFYKANFDLEDCDKILRIKSSSGSVRSLSIIALVNEFGFDAEILPEDIPVIK